MKKIICTLVLLVVALCCVSAFELQFIGDMEHAYSDVQKVIVVYRDVDFYKIDVGIGKEVVNQAKFIEYIIVRDSGLYHTLSNQFVTNAPIVCADKLKREEKKKYGLGY